MFPHPVEAILKTNYYVRGNKLALKFWLIGFLTCSCERENLHKIPEIISTSMKVGEIITHRYASTCTNFPVKNFYGC